MEGSETGSQTPRESFQLHKDPGSGILKLLGLTIVLFGRLAFIYGRSRLAFVYEVKNN